jgi:glycosyltransferase involved in cell wall biosynthesis
MYWGVNHNGMKKVLFIASHRLGRSPGQRFRFEEYFNYLNKNGFQCDFEYMISTEDDKTFYSPGNFFKKGLIYLKCWIKRFRDTLKARGYDIVFIQREAFMTGSIYFEKRFKKSGAKNVFDFDDSIWLQNVSDANKTFAFLKDASKTSKLIAMADQVIAGNEYLAEYARRFNSPVTIIPTTIDTDEYKPVKGGRDLNKVTIGWSGSFTTIQHFKLAVPALSRIKQKYGSKIQVKVIGDANYRNDELDVISLNWNKEDELKELSSFDIGLMPLPDDEWAKGKCGLKGLQYMALEIPTIMSPVGVNSEIITDGVNGYLAGSDDEWVEKMSLLIENLELRSQIGNAGRNTVIERYSVEAQKDNYLNLLRKLV